MIDQKMSLAHTIIFQNVCAFCEENEPCDWSFFPLRADVQRNENGAPLVTLFELGSSAQLTFSTLWQAKPDDLSALTELIGQFGGVDRTPKLSFSPIRSPQCRILVNNGLGGFAPIAVSGTSGYPPYQALFNLALTGDELDHARAALRGESGHVLIEYSAEASAPLASEARLRADGEQLFAWFAERGGGAEVSSGLLEQAIEQGLVRIEIEAGADNSWLWRRRLIDAASPMMRAWLSSHAAGSHDAFEVSLSGVEAQPVPLSLSTDLGALLASSHP